MAYVPTLKTQYKERIEPALMKEFGYSSVMQCPKLTKIVINQGMGQAVADKKIIETALDEMAEKLGVSRDTYRKIEMSPEDATVAIAKKISEVVGIPIDQIFFADLST